MYQYEQSTKKTNQAKQVGSRRIQKTNALPRKRVVRMRTPLGRIRLTADKAIELRKTIRENAWKRRRLVKKKEADGSAEIDEK